MLLRRRSQGRGEEPSMKQEARRDGLMKGRLPLPLTPQRG